MKRKLSPRALYGFVVGGLLVYALFGWFVFVGPKRAEAALLKEEVAAAQLAVTNARAAAEVKENNVQPLAVADIFRLAKAMPAVPDMPGILLELSRIAGETGIQFRSISPQPAVGLGSYQSVPISLLFDGNFYELSDFLFRLRTLVAVRRGELHAEGRLFVVESLGFAEGAKSFPEITATLTVNTFVFSNVAPPPVAAVPPVVPAGEEAPAGEAPVAEASP